MNSRRIACQPTRGKRTFTVGQPRVVRLYGLYLFFLAARIGIDPQEVALIGDQKSFTGDPVEPIAQRLVLTTSLQRKKKKTQPFPVMGSVKRTDKQRVTEEGWSVGWSDCTPGIKLQTRWKAPPSASHRHAQVYINNKMTEEKGKSLVTMMHRIELHLNKTI